MVLSKKKVEAYAKYRNMIFEMSGRKYLITTSDGSQESECDNLQECISEIDSMAVSMVYQHQYKCKECEKEISCNKGRELAKRAFNLLR